jgi:hypothetical protein
MPAVIRARDWELLREVARLAKEDAPIELAATDPTRYRALREAITRFHLGGWSAMTPNRVDKVVQELATAGEAKTASTARGDDRTMFDNMNAGG